MDGNAEYEIAPACWVIGVDPGRSAGVFGLRNGLPAGFYQGPPEGALAYLERLLEFVEPDGGDVLVAMERFTGGSARHTRQTDAQQVVGAVIELAARYGIPVVFQSPADAKSFTTNDFLRKLDLWVTPAEVGAPDADDVRDAARHALLCLATHRAQTYCRLLERTRRPDATID
jgi:hypothetical protein